MNICGWGRYPMIEAVVEEPLSQEVFQTMVQLSSPKSLIAKGCGRSYGDSALASHVLSTRYLDHFLDFNQNSGVLRCSAGVSLATILSVFVSRGWFLPVTPGTQFVSIGGAIASDVHGKNHHVHGCFSEFVDKLTVLLANGEILSCSRTEHATLFHATCGGMGLTGIILEVTLRLKPIQSSMIEQTVIKAHDLLELFVLLDTHCAKTYSVAWLDCLAKKPMLGRSLLSVGEHAQIGALLPLKQRLLNMPIDMPSICLNRFVAQSFNTLYYHQDIWQKRKSSQVSYGSFFYPLDRLGFWNRLYGRKGFIQYQCVIPKLAALEGIRILLERISEGPSLPLLAVLKTFSKENANFLSFPLEGYTLAVDFKMDESLLGFLEELDTVVLAHGGRLYLTKDARMSSATFKQGYPRWEAFQAVRERYGAIGRFVSKQSQRLGLDTA